MKIGLKVYAENLFYIKDAINLYKSKVIDYIEIFITTRENEIYIKNWMNTGIPIALHAPHSMAGFNPASKDKFDDKLEIISRIKKIVSIVNPIYIVFHPGINGNVKNTVNTFNVMLNKFPKMANISLIENKPFLGMNNENCIGSTPEEIKLIMNETGMGFLLDFGHAICAAASRRIDYKKYISQFLDIVPSAYHLSDGHIESQYDEHLHINRGNFDIYWILKKIDSTAFVTLETEKNSIKNLDDFLIDVTNIINIQERKYVK